MEQQVIQIGKKGILTIKEVNQVLMVLRPLTQRYKNHSEKLMNQLESIDAQNWSKIEAKEGEINQAINEWQNKVVKLGGEPKGLWLIDFDAGDGYFCWKFPEPEILYWHGYLDGFSGRVLITQRQEKGNPATSWQLPITN